MVFNSNKLRAFMIEKGYSAERMSRILGINPSTMSRKMSGITEFTRYEIQLMATSLGLSAQDIESIFFAKELA